MPSDVHQSQTSSRVQAFDVARGFSVVSMVLFHFCYDLRYIAGLPLTWFQPPLQDIWRCSISWVFVFIAGCMFAWSHNNLKRALRYLAVALLVYIVTTLVAVDTPISFGVIYCMGACTLVCWLLDKVGFRPTGVGPALCLFGIFLLTQHLAEGYFGIGSLVIPIPRAFYATPWLSWLGFPGPHFASGDYYPLLPYLFLYLAGSAIGRMWQLEGVPAFFSRISCAPLEWIGQHALPIYIVHQPILLLLTMLVTRIATP